MRIFGNLIWFVFGGLEIGLGWILAGVLWSITVVGIPLGMQCFKFAKLTFFPFGKKIIYAGGVGATLLNVLWLIFSGIPLAICSAVTGVLSLIHILYDRSCRILYGLLEEGGDEAAECAYYLGYNQMNMGQYDKALRFLRGYLDAEPEGEYAEDAEDMICLLYTSAGSPGPELRCHRPPSWQRYSCGGRSPQRYREAG